MEKNLLPMVFNHEEFGQLRVLKINEVPWAVAADVAKILEIKNHRDAVGRLDDDEKDDVGITDAIGRVQKTLVINESGLYSLIFQSRKPYDNKKVTTTSGAAFFDNQKRLC